MADSNFYGATSLTGGGDKALDSYDGDDLNDGDGAVAILDGATSYIYHLDATSGLSEDSPEVIAPDDNAGDKRWILTAVYSAAGGLEFTDLSDTPNEYASGEGGKGVRVKDDLSGLEFYTIPEGGTDEKVGIDSGAAAGYIGAASNDGVLRITSPLSYANGGNFVTIGIDTAATMQIASLGLGKSPSLGQLDIESTEIFGIMYKNTDAASYSQLGLRNDANEQLYLGVSGSSVGGAFADLAYLNAPSGHAFAILIGGSQKLKVDSTGNIVTGVWQATDVGISYGGTGQSTAQAAIDALSAVAGATNEYVLTKDTATGNAVWKVAAGGDVTFLALTDTPNEYASADIGKVVKVKDDLSGLEFAEESGGPHTIVSHSDTTATGAELEELTDGSQTALHSHAGGGATFLDLSDTPSSYDSADIGKYVKVKDDLSGLEFGTPAGGEGGGFTSKVNAYLNNDQTIVKQTWTTIAFDVENYDTDSEFDITTNKGRFTASAAGYYHISAATAFKSMDDQKFAAIKVNKNGTPYFETGIHQSYIGVEVALLVQLSGDIYLEAGEWIEIQSYHDAVGNEVLDGREKITSVQIHRFA